MTCSNMISSAFGHTQPILSRVIVTKPEDLQGELQSDKMYFLDGNIDMKDMSITVPVNGLNMSGLGVNISGLFSSEDNYDMFIGAPGGAGSIACTQCRLSVTGDVARVFNLTAAVPGKSFGMGTVMFFNCTAMGYLKGYTQGFEVGTIRVLGSPLLVMDGAWDRGYTITNGIVQALDAEMTGPILSAGPTFVMQGICSLQAQVDLVVDTNWIDFTDANFPNPNTLRVNGSQVSFQGVLDVQNTGLISPNITEKSISSSWTGNFGMRNTFVGGRLDITTELVTTIVTQGVFETLQAVWAADNLQHFDVPAAGQLRHIGNVPRDYNILLDIVLTGVANNEVTLRVEKWSEVNQAVETVYDQCRPINPLPGGRNAAFLTIVVNLTLDQGDYVYLKVANMSGTTDVSAEIAGFFIVEAR